MVHACLRYRRSKRGATETCPSLSCLTGAQSLVEMTCLGLSSAHEAQKELLEKPQLQGGGKTAVLWITLSVMLHQQQDPKGKQSQQSAVPCTEQPCEVANFSILQYPQDLTHLPEVLSTPVFTDNEGNIHFTVVLTCQHLFWYPGSSPHHHS